MISDLISVIRGNMTPLAFFIQLGAIVFVVFCATPIHEYAHALIATKLGDETPRAMGRLTIRPLAHIDPIGALMIFLFGFGYAKPVQVRMARFKNPKRDMALVALAGPVSNLLQAFVCSFVCSACYFGAMKLENMALLYISDFFLFAAIININLAVFNFLPIPPLDGSRLVTALLPARIYYKIMQYERYIQIALFVLLFTGVLSKPLSIVSGFLVEAFVKITSLPFGL